MIGNYEETQSKSGKFVENVFRALQYIINKEILTEIKPNEMERISNALAQLDKSTYSESIRLLIPNISRTLIYLPRSKLGSVHQKLITPDFIDAKLTIEASNWIMAEFLRQYGKQKRNIQLLIDNIFNENFSIIQNSDDEIFIDAEITCEEEILIRLHISNNGLDRNELRQTIKNFSPFHVTKKLKELKKFKSIFVTQKKRYIIAESARRKIRKRIAELSMNIATRQSSFQENYTRPKTL